MYHSFSSHSDMSIVGRRREREKRRGENKIKEERERK
jgi:hypothetical protein